MKEILWEGLLVTVDSQAEVIVSWDPNEVKENTLVLGVSTSCPEGSVGIERILKSSHVNKESGRILQMFYKFTNVGL